MIMEFDQNLPKVLFKLGQLELEKTGSKKKKKCGSLKLLMKSIYKGSVKRAIYLEEACQVEQAALVGQREAC